jgi:hypothetical protein
MGKGRGRKAQGKDKAVVIIYGTAIGGEVGAMGSARIRTGMRFSSGERRDQDELELELEGTEGRGSEIGERVGVRLVVHHPLDRTQGVASQTRRMQRQRQNQ